MHSCAKQAEEGEGREREREKPLYNKPKFVFFLYMYIIFSLYKGRSREVVLEAERSSALTKVQMVSCAWACRHYLATDMQPFKCSSLVYFWGGFFLGWVFFWGGGGGSPLPFPGPFC